MTSLIDKLRTHWYILKYQHVLQKATFGPDTLIRCKLMIKGPGKVTIGAGCRFEPTPWGEEYVTIYTHSPQAKITIGNHVFLRATRFGSHVSITVENDAVLEYSSIFDSDFHNLNATKRDEDFHHGDRAVVIGAGSYVGCECLCSKGTVLGHHVILLPGTVVGTKKIPANRTLCGNPAKLIRSG